MFFIFYVLLFCYCCSFCFWTSLPNITTEYQWGGLFHRRLDFVKFNSKARERGSYDLRHFHTHVDPFFWMSADITKRIRKKKSEGHARFFVIGVLWQILPWNRMEYDRGGSSLHTQQRSNKVLISKDVLPTFLVKSNRTYLFRQVDVNHKNYRNIRSLW